MTHSATPRVPLFCSFHILTSSVIYYWTDTRQHGIYLFYIITKSLFYFKIFQHNAKAGLLPRLCAAFARKRAISRDLCLFTMTQFHWLLCVARVVIAREKSRHCQSLLVERKLTAKAELNCEIYKSWRECWKNQVSFCHRSSPLSQKAWTLPWKLRELKNTLVVTVNLEAIWFEFWMKGA